VSPRSTFTPSQLKKPVPFCKKCVNAKLRTNAGFLALLQQSEFVFATSDCYKDDIEMLLLMLCYIKNGINFPFYDRETGLLSIFVSGVHLPSVPMEDIKNLLRLKADALNIAVIFDPVHISNGTLEQAAGREKADRNAVIAYCRMIDPGYTPGKIGWNPEKETTLEAIFEAHQELLVLQFSRLPMRLFIDLVLKNPEKTVTHMVWKGGSNLNSLEELKRNNEAVYAELVSLEGNYAMLVIDRTDPELSPTFKTIGDTTLPEHLEEMFRKSSFSFAKKGVNTATDCLDGPVLANFFKDTGTSTKEALKEFLWKSYTEKGTQELFKKLYREHSEYLRKDDKNPYYYDIDAPSMTGYAKAFSDWYSGNLRHEACDIKWFAALVSGSAKLRGHGNKRTFTLSDTASAEADKAVVEALTF
jgi:hypothetical protein